MRAPFPMRLFTEINQNKQKLEERKAHIKNSRKLTFFGGISFERITEIHVLWCVVKFGDFVGYQNNLGQYLDTFEVDRFRMCQRRSCDALTMT